MRRSVEASAASGVGAGDGGPGGWSRPCCLSARGQAIITPAGAEPNVAGVACRNASRTRPTLFGVGRRQLGLLVL